MGFLDLLLEWIVGAPFSLGLLLVGAAIGWMLFGLIGLLFGATIGALVGVFFDTSNHHLAKTLRMPVSVMTALGLLALALQIMMR